MDTYGQVAVAVLRIFLPIILIIMIFTIAFLLQNLAYLQQV